MGTATLVRRCGVVVAVGAAAWAVASLVAGPIKEGANSGLELAGSFAFQVGVLGLVAALWATGGAGRGRWSRAVLAIQAVLVMLAMGWTVPHVFEPNMASEGIMAALDAAWPLSMLWLLVQGATVARARRWPGALRWLPLAGGLWFPVAIAGLAAGEWPGLVVSNLWLVATFVPLGLLLSVRAGTVDAAGEPRPGANVGRAFLRSEPHPTG